MASFPPILVFNKMGAPPRRRKLFGGEGLFALYLRSVFSEASRRRGVAGCVLMRESGMRKFYSAFVMLQLALALGAPAARAGVSCAPQTAGVGGVIADQTDVIAAVNCLGQQIAELRNAAVAADRLQTSRAEELSRQISALQFVIDSQSRRIAELESRIIDIQRPLAARPW
jgi:hypothetical protein